MRSTESITVNLIYDRLNYLTRPIGIKFSRRVLVWETKLLQHNVMSASGDYRPEIWVHEA